MEVSHIDLERMIRGRKSIVSTLQPRSLCFYFETILSLSLSPSPSLSLHLYLISESLSKPFSLLSFIFTISLKSYYHSLSAVQMEINGKRLSFLFFFLKPGGVTSHTEAVWRWFPLWWWVDAIIYNSEMSPNQVTLYASDTVNVFKQISIFHIQIVELQRWENVMTWETVKSVS